MYVTKKSKSQSGRCQVELEMTRSGRIRKKINTQKYNAAIEGMGEDSDDDDEFEGAEPGDMDDYKPESDTEEIAAQDDEGRDSPLDSLAIAVANKQPRKWVAN